MKIRSLLLGTAALFVTGAVANAADAPASKMESACEFGDSYFAIGGGNCLDISGRARFEYHVSSGTDGYDTSVLNVVDDDDADLEDDIDQRTDLQEEIDLSNLSANGRVDFTVMSATDMGPLKGFLRLDGDLAKAYVSWNGITAGETDSFFGFSTGLGANEASHETGGWDSAVPLLAYTFDAGNGITATVSAEKRDAGAVKAGSGSSTSTSVTTADTTALAAVLVNAERVTAALLNGADAGGSSPFAVTDGVLTGGTATYNLPDFVLDIEVAQDWGSAGISGAITGVRVIDPSDTTKTIDETGYAVAGGVSVNVPGVEGLSISARGTYAVGAPNYTEYDTAAWLHREASDITADDTISTDDDFELALSTVWDIGVGASMDISDTMSANIAVSYMNIDQDEVEKILLTGADDAELETRLNVSGALYWTPVSDLTVGLEGFYQQNNFKGYYASDADNTNDDVTNDDITRRSEEGDYNDYGASLTITRTF